MILWLHKRMSSLSSNINIRLMVQCAGTNTPYAWGLLHSELSRCLYSLPFIDANLNTSGYKPPFWPNHQLKAENAKCFQSLSAVAANNTKCTHRPTVKGSCKTLNFQLFLLFPKQIYIYMCVYVCMDKL